MSRAVSPGPLWAALIALLLAGCDTPVITADEVPGITHVSERRRSAADVARATEAFRAQEDHGADIVFRTEEKARPGHYFFIQLAVAPPRDGRLILEVVRQENAAPERYDFAVTLQPGFPFGEYVIGLTGAQAGDADWRPVAWRVSVVDAQGKVLAARRSFLWGAPGDTRPR